MERTNYDRMIELADSVFDTKNDTDQIDVNQEVIHHFMQIHPSTVCEYDEGNGPVAWVLILPTTAALMHQFIEQEISEKELYERTPLNVKYEALYLCSALVLEEYRRKGITKMLALNAIQDILKDHPIKALFAWSFTKEGDMAAKSIAEHAGLPLYNRRPK